MARRTGDVVSDGPFRRVLPALLVCVIWGVNFSAIEQAAEVFPPMLLAFLRFLLCVVPVILFVQRPQVSVWAIVGYGLTFGVLQFAFLFAGMSVGAGAGVASFLLQSQAFFTVLLSFLMLNERTKRYQVVGLVLGFLGITVVLLTQNENVTLLGGGLVVAAGLSWGSANLIVKVVKPDNALSFIVYASAVAVLPFLALTLIVDGPTTIVSAFRDARWPAYASLLYLVYPTTLVGYAIWNRLLKTYPAVSVAPFALLIPIVGVLGAALWHGENPTGPQYVGFAAILGGLVVCQFWPVITRTRHPRVEEVQDATS